MPILGMEISLLLSYFYVWQEVSKYFRLQWQETLLSCKMKPNKSYRSYFLWCQNEIFSARCHAKLTCQFIENIMPGIIHRQRVFHEITLTFLMAFHFLTKSNQNSLITPLENAQYWHLKQLNCCQVAWVTNGLFVKHGCTCHVNEPPSWKIVSVGESSPLLEDLAIVSLTYSNVHFFDMSFNVFSYKLSVFVVLLLWHFDWALVVRDG